MSIIQIDVNNKVFKTGNVLLCTYTKTRFCSCNQNVSKFYPYLVIGKDEAFRTKNYVSLLQAHSAKHGIKGMLLIAVLDTTKVANSLCLL